MTPFPANLTSVAAPLIRDNVDTDAIIPSREMRSTGKTGLAAGLFAAWRYLDAAARTPDPDFVLNDPAYADTHILLGGANFGCGSSREHAVWALAEYGFRAVIAESFAPIFRNNCVRNGVLPVVLPHEAITEMAGRAVTIDLSAQTADHHRFEIDAEAKAMLLEGLDAIDLTMKHAAAIAAWQARDKAARPYIYLVPPHLDGEGNHAQHGGGVKKLPPKTNGAVLRARALRRSMSPQELLLWRELRKRPSGLKFRNQYPAGPYHLDFYCPAASLCIEIDGISHDMGDNSRRGAARGAFMAEHGIKTIRFTASEVHRNLDGVTQAILLEAKRRLLLHRPADGSPPHRDGEERI